MRRDVSVANADEDGSEGQDATDQAMDMVAYALVSVVDEAALLDLFNAQSTRLEFVEREGSNGRLPPVKDRFVRISVLDFAEKRVVKLSEGDFCSRTPYMGDPEEICRITAPCRFV